MPIGDQLPAWARDGVRYSLVDDPEDPRFQILTYRKPKNSALLPGAGNTESCDHASTSAMTEYVRMCLAVSAGFVGQALPQVSELLLGIYDKLGGNVTASRGN